MLNVTGLHYKIGNKSILKDLNIDFNPGEFNIILGPNGSGKSTFLKVISGALEGYTGTVFYSGQDLKKIPTKILATQRAVMTQQPELTFPLSVNEVIMMGRYPHFNFNPGEKDFRICNEVTQLLSLNNFKDRNYLTLSGGEKQRVHFARLLVQVWEKPESGYRYLFLDEPLTSLDINYQQEFLQLIRTLMNKDTVLIAVLHDINLAIQFGEKLFFIKDGQMVASGQPSSLVTEFLIEDIFAVKSRIIQNPLTGLPLMVYK